MGFHGGSNGKGSACNAGDPGLTPGLRSPGEENGNPLQYSCLKNSMDRGAWWATIHGVAKIRTQLSDFTHYEQYWILDVVQERSKILFLKTELNNHMNNSTQVKYSVTGVWFHEGLCQRILT